ncbi:MAG: ParB/RepB/Spo0J family partition protein [Gammaproteobacteria bacterium]
MENASTIPLSQLAAQYIEDTIPIEQIITDHNYRKVISEASISDLASSIQRYGLFNPVIVIDLENDQYQLCAGGRRIQALIELGLTRLPKASVYPKQALPYQQVIMYADNFEREDVALGDVLNGIEAVLAEADGSTEDVQEIKQKLDDQLKEMGHFIGMPRRLVSVYSKIAQAYLLKNPRGQYVFPAYRKLILESVIKDQSALYDLALALLEALGTKREKKVTQKLREIRKGVVKDSVRKNAVKLKKFAQGQTGQTGIVRKNPQQTQSRAKSEIRLTQEANKLHQVMTQFEGHLKRLDGSLTSSDRQALHQTQQQAQRILNAIATLCETEDEV